MLKSYWPQRKFKNLEDPWPRAALSAFNSGAARCGVERLVLFE
jgi:hypothetical protein